MNADILQQAATRLDEIAAQVTLLRNEELKIRNYIADAVHTGESGSKTVEIDGIKLTVNRPVTYSIAKADAEAFRQSDPVSAALLLTWSPKVSVTGFKELADNPVVARIVTTKPGPPTVTFK